MYCAVRGDKMEMFLERPSKVFPVKEQTQPGGKPKAGID
jgi:hypothetical protein